MFGVLPRRSDAGADCKRVQEWLEDALCWTGAGAKTAVGYGRFAPDAEARQAFEEKSHKRRAEQAVKEEKAQRQRERENQTRGKSELYTELYITSLNETWLEDKNAFSQAGLIEGWLERLEADPQADATALMAELMRKHFADVMTEPDAVEGRRQKPKFKDRQRNFVKRMLKLLAAQ